MRKNHYLPLGFSKVLLMNQLYSCLDTDLQNFQIFSEQKLLYIKPCTVELVAWNVFRHLSCCSFKLWWLKKTHVYIKLSQGFEPKEAWRKYKKNWWVFSWFKIFFYLQDWAALESHAIWQVSSCKKYIYKWRGTV